MLLLLKKPFLLSIPNYSVSDINFFIYMIKTNHNKWVIRGKYRYFLEAIASIKIKEINNIPWHNNNYENSTMLH